MVTTPAVARIQFLTSSTLAPPFYILIIPNLFTTVNRLSQNLVLIIYAKGFIFMDKQDLFPNRFPYSGKLYTDCNQKD